LDKILRYSGKKNIDYLHVKIDTDPDPDPAPETDPARQTLDADAYPDPAK
jgi:hypothetical protein